MTFERRAIALGLLVVWFVLAFVVRALVHLARTGSLGIKGISGKPGSIEWWGGGLFVAALLLGPVAAVGHAPGGQVRPLASPMLKWVGVALMVGGIVGTVRSQRAMGKSWRIGVDPNESTELVTEGVFALMRNPIYTAMLIGAAGLVLVVPNLVALAHVSMLIVALELQVRKVEEPYLIQKHGDAYVGYARQVGRFFPGIGRI